MLSGPVQELDVAVGGRTVHGWDSGPTGRADELVVGWHGGTPNTGEPPAPLLPASAALGIRWIGADRPGYGGSDPFPGSTLATDARDLAAVADAAGVGRFAVLGHSGGGPRAIASAALLPDRTLAAVTVASPAPRDAAGLDFLAGMRPAIVREHAAASRGRAAMEAVLAEDDWDPAVFTAADEEALSGDWGWFLGVVGRATARGPAGQVQDGLIGAAPWPLDLAGLRVPVLVVHGADDRLVPVAHARWLAAHAAGAELRIAPGAGHVSVLRDEGPAALSWLRAAAER